MHVAVKRGRILGPALGVGEAGDGPGNHEDRGHQNLSVSYNKELRCYENDVWEKHIFAVEKPLHTRNKLGFINGKTVRNENDALLQDQWDRRNSVLLSWLLGCISQELYKLQIFSKNAKKVWDELEETYNKEDGSVIFNMHYKIHSYTQSCSPLSEYYRNLNALWRQFDALVNLPNCTCAGAEALKKHNQLLRLMQFLMGLDDVFAPIRSQILTTNKPLPHYLEMSHTGLITFIIIRVDHLLLLPDLMIGILTKSQNKKFNRPTLGCKHCNRIGHTIDRCFELVGYPSNFKKRDNQNVSINAAVAGNKVDHKPGPSVTHTFTDDHLQKLVALISDKSGSGCVPVNVAGFYSKEPGGTGSEKGGLYFFETETRSDEPYDDKERDKTTVNSKDTNPSSLGGTENASSTKKDDGGHPGTPE
ncbi:hypothetical protein Tco_1541957 [Tanacetum coccineum]